MRETPIDGSSTMVSTSTTFVPPFWIFVNGPAEAVRSLGATSRASGAAAATASSIGFCSVASKRSGPWTSSDMPSASAASWAPHSMEM
jgi:hypothetical protein